MILLHPGVNGYQLKLVILEDINGRPGVTSLGKGSKTNFLTPSRVDGYQFRLKSRRLSIDPVSCPFERDSLPSYLGKGL